MATHSSLQRREPTFQAHPDAAPRIRPDPTSGLALRAAVVSDQVNTMQHASVNSLNAGPGRQEGLRIHNGLQPAVSHLLNRSMGGAAP